MLSLMKTVETGRASSKEEFAANGSEADGENLPESRAEKNAPQMLKAYICREAYQERLTPDSLYTNLKNLKVGRNRSEIR